MDKEVTLTAIRSALAQTRNLIEDLRHLESTLAVAERNLISDREKPFGAADEAAQKLSSGEI